MNPKNNRFFRSLGNKRNDKEDNLDNKKQIIDSLNGVKRPIDALSEDKKRITELDEKLGKKELEDSLNGIKKPLGGLSEDKKRITELDEKLGKKELEDSLNGIKKPLGSLGEDKKRITELDEKLGKKDLEDSLNGIKKPLGGLSEDKKRVTELNEELGKKQLEDSLMGKKKTPHDLETNKIDILENNPIKKEVIDSLNGIEKPIDALSSDKERKVYLDEKLGKEKPKDPKKEDNIEVLEDPLTHENARKVLAQKILDKNRKGKIEQDLPEENNFQRSLSFRPRRVVNVRHSSKKVLPKDIKRNLVVYKRRRNIPEGKVIVKNEKKITLDIPSVKENKDVIQNKIGKDNKVDFNIDDKGFDLPKIDNKSNLTGNEISFEDNKFEPRKRRPFLLGRDYQKSNVNTIKDNKKIDEKDKEKQDGEPLKKGVIVSTSGNFEITDDTQYNWRVQGKVNHFAKEKIDNAKKQVTGEVEDNLEEEPEKRNGVNKNRLIWHEDEDNTLETEETQVPSSTEETTQGEQKRNLVPGKVNDIAQAGNKAIPKAVQKGAKDQVKKKTTQAAAQVAGEKAKSALLGLIAKHPVVLIVLGVAALLLIIFIVLFGIFIANDGTDTENTVFVDTRYDFTQTTVTLTNSYRNEEEKIAIQQLMFEDLIKGAAYTELYKNLNGLSREEMVELFSANMIVFRGLALNIGKYDSTTKEIEIQSGQYGVPYCDINKGCDIVSSNGLTTYLISTYDGRFTGNKIGSIPPAEGDVLDALNEAYEKTKYLVIVPSSFDDVLKTYDFGNPPYNQRIKQSMINYAKNEKNFENIIRGIADYNTYKIYNLEEHTMKYTYSNSTTYWWPVGGAIDSEGLYSGISRYTTITSPFSYRVDPINGSNAYHTGTDIGAPSGEVVIAARSGTVTVAKYDNSYGNYVEIDHGDGIRTRYAHMQNNSIVVKVGDTVTQGQKIGIVGATGRVTGPHLHFEVLVNGTRTEPMNYIDPNNQRPVEISSVQNADGTSNAQSVCLALKSAGFSNNATAGLMANMYEESGFRVNVHGDSGTSYGLCQWHNGRYDNLQNYCGSEIDTVECQVDFLIYELKSSQVGVYNKLLSNASAEEMASYFCLNFERPYNKNVTCPNRAQKYSATYLNYAKNGCN